MKELRIEDFEKVDSPNTLGHYYRKKMPDGGEICLESCFSGYCVARYDKNLSIIGEKECTRMDSYFPGDKSAIEKALKLANKFL